MITNILSGFDLGNKEIKVFNKVLELGSQPASNIARVLEMPRNTVRSILDGLVKKNLLIKTNRANVQYYCAENKKNIIRYLKHKKVKTNEKIDEQISLIENYGDELDLKFRSKIRPKITFYEGLDGIEKVYEDTLTSSGEIKSWASFETMHGVMPKYFKTYYEKRAKKGILIHSIHPDTELSRERKKNDVKEMRDSILVPADEFHCSPEIQVYNDKVNIISWKEKLGIIIESHEIAEAMNSIFDLCFGKSGKEIKVKNLKGKK